MNTLSLDNVSSLQIDGQKIVELAIDGVPVWSAWKNRFTADIFANAYMTGTLCKSLYAKINSFCEIASHLYAESASVKNAVSTAEASINSTAKEIRALAKQTNAAVKPDIETTAQFMSVAYRLPQADVIFILNTNVHAESAPTVKGKSVIKISGSSEAQAGSVEVLTTNASETIVIGASALSKTAETTKTKINAVIGASTVCKASAVMPTKTKANAGIELETTAIAEAKDLEPWFVQEGTELQITGVWAAELVGANLRIGNEE